MQDRCVYWIDCAAVAIKEGFTFVHSVLPSRDRGIIGDIAKKIEKTVGRDMLQNQKFDGNKEYSAMIIML